MVFNIASKIVTKITCFKPFISFLTLWRDMIYFLSDIFLGVWRCISSLPIYFRNPLIRRVLSRRRRATLMSKKIEKQRRGVLFMQAFHGAIYLNKK